MVDPLLVGLRKRLDFESDHKAFLDDFAGWPKPEQSRFMRLAAGDDGVLPFLDVFAHDLMHGPTRAWNERMIFLGRLCGRLEFDYPLSDIVGYIANELENLGEMGAGESPEMLPLAVADLNSPPEQPQSAAALARAIDRTSDASFGFGQFPIS